MDLMQRCLLRGCAHEPMTEECLGQATLWSIENFWLDP